jgi:hypothetical protein
VKKAPIVQVNAKDMDQDLLHVEVRPQRHEINGTGLVKWEIPKDGKDPCG